MKMVASDISGEEKVIVKGKGWIPMNKLKANDYVKTNEGWQIIKWRY